MSKIRSPTWLTKKRVSKQQYLLKLKFHIVFSKGNGRELPIYITPIIPKNLQIQWRDFEDPAILPHAFSIQVHSPFPIGGSLRTLRV